MEIKVETIIKTGESKRKKLREVTESFFLENGTQREN